MSISWLRIVTQHHMWALPFLSAQGPWMDGGSRVSVFLLTTCLAVQGSPKSLSLPKVCVECKPGKRSNTPLGWSTAKCSQATPAYAALRLCAVKLSVQSPLHLLQSASAEVVSRQGFCPEACLPVSTSACETSKAKNSLEATAKRSRESIQVGLENCGILARVQRIVVRV